MGIRSICAGLAAVMLVAGCDSSGSSPQKNNPSRATGSDAPMPVLQNADPAIGALIRKAYDAAAKGDRETVVRCSHPEIGKFKGSFDTGYSPGRSGSLGELANWAVGVQGGDKVQITNLRVEVVKQEADRAIAWVKYHAVESPLAIGQWDAKDYVILKKHTGEWRLRRMEDRAGHYFPLEQQDHSDPWGGVQ